MKNFILENGDAIINYGAWICSGIISLGCFIIFMNFLDLSNKTGNGSLIFTGLAISSIAWVFGMLCVVQIFYFLYGFIDVRDNLNDIKNLLVYNGGNSNLSNQPNPNIIKEYTQSYQSIRKMKSSISSEQDQTKPCNDNQEQNICIERQNISNETEKNKNKDHQSVQFQSDFEALAQPKSGILTFDKLQLHTPSLIDKTVDVEGYCTFSDGHFYLSKSGSYNDTLNSILLSTDNLSQDTRELLYEVCKDGGTNITMKILVKGYRPEVLKIYGNIN